MYERCLYLNYARQQMEYLINNSIQYSDKLVKSYPISEYDSPCYLTYSNTDGPNMTYVMTGTRTVNANTTIDSTSRRVASWYINLADHSGMIFATYFSLSSSDFLSITEDDWIELSIRSGETDTTVYSKRYKLLQSPVNCIHDVILLNDKETYNYYIFFENIWTSINNYQNSDTT